MTDRCPTCGSTDPHRDSPGWVAEYPGTHCTDGWHDRPTEDCPNCLGFSGNDWCKVCDGTGHVIDRPTEADDYANHLRQYAEHMHRSQRTAGEQLLLDAADAFDALKAEVARLTAERDYWQNAAYEGDKLHSDDLRAEVARLTAAIHDIDLDGSRSDLRAWRNHVLGEVLDD